MPDKVYAAKPAPGPIELSLAGKSSHERAAIRADSITGLSLSGLSFTHDGMTVTVTRGPLLFTWTDGTGTSKKGVELWVTAIENGVTLIFDPHLRFVNPPVKVPNGTWRTENGTDIENMKESALDAAKQMVVHAIRGAV